MDGWESVVVRIEEHDVVGWVMVNMWLDGELEVRPDHDCWRAYARYDAWREARKQRAVGANADD